jgi:hypothetical protein
LEELEAVREAESAKMEELENDVAHRGDMNSDESSSGNNGEDKSPREKEV